MNSKSSTREEAQEKLTPKRARAELVEAPPSLESSGDELSEKGCSYEDTFPDGGRGWVVALGCFIFSAATVGWGYVFSFSRC